MFANKNYLDEPQDTEFNRTVINFIKEFKKFKGNTAKQSNEIQKQVLRGNKCVRDVQENTNIKLMK